MKQILVAAWLILGGVMALLAQSQPGAAGHWEGSIATPNGEMPFGVDLKLEGKTWIGTFTGPGAKGMPLADVTVKESGVNFAIKAPGAPRFQGTVAAEGGKMTGEMKQGDFKTTFQLTRKGEAVIVKVAPLAPVSKDLEGTWEGTLEAGGQQLRLRFVFGNEGDAGTGKIFSLDQGNVEIPITALKLVEAKVNLEAQMVGGSFDGELKGNELTGTWSQGPGTMPLKLAKAGAPAAK
jgi:hypothetical protein